VGDWVSQTVGGVTTRYTLDLNADLTQILADGTNTYLYGNERIAQYSGMSPSYFMRDALESVRQLADNTGACNFFKRTIVFLVPICPHFAGLQMLALG